jgi:hypothetical protein
MSVVAIAYFSGYGHTAKQAEAVADGVRSAGATARVYRLTDQGDLPDVTTLEDVGQANAIIYGSPTYMGGPLAVQEICRCLFVDFQIANLETMGATWLLMSAGKPRGFGGANGFLAEASKAMASNDT